MSELGMPTKPAMHSKNPDLPRFRRGERFVIRRDSGDEGSQAPEHHNKRFYSRGASWLHSTVPHSRPAVTVRTYQG